ncbi:flagellar motor protein MotB [Robertmurraya kyonggiensis]|uniref:Flagellar motor protein MotB n=1 Tax=Robertmurraya kyonggiensis TaxID=1037680 RepID=A0A4U1D2G2_9BACI|nr:flagellar motor protein MotB [Robertmurraya kyonggiensis]TKC16274.1 flagellar motor protein MotB [Robertmurraya kyonggiensis]
MSKRRRKKEHHEEHVDESWLIPYADILTLLLALFIVLFSMSTVDAQKLQAMSQAFNEALSSGTGIFEYPSPMPENEAQALDDVKSEEDEEQNEEKAKQIEKLELENIQKKVEAYIAEKNLTDKLDTSLTDEGLLLTIRDNVLFPSGSSEVRAEDLKTASEISDLLVMSPPRNIVISGHTDNVPIKNPQFESNWELSVMRAINFMKILLKNDQLNPQWFSAKGFGEFQPVASNDSAEGKAKNRRVEILILPRTSTN